MVSFVRALVAVHVHTVYTFFVPFCSKFRLILALLFFFLSVFIAPFGGLREASHTRKTNHCGSPSPSRSRFPEYLLMPPPFQIPKTFAS